MQLYIKDSNNYIIDYDSYVDSPREYDDLFTFYTWHKRYNSPDNNPYSIEGFKELMGIDDLTDIEYIKDYVCYTVSMYDHSGIALSISRELKDVYNDMWDSGILGFIFAKKSDILSFFDEKEFNDEVEEKAFKYAYNQVKAYQNYCNGEVYCWEQFEIDSNNEIEVLESCGGYYNIDDLLGELRLTDDDYIRDFNNDDEIIGYMVRGKDEI